MRTDGQFPENSDLKVLHAAETIKGGVASVIKLLCTAPKEASAGSVTFHCLVPESQAEELQSLPPTWVTGFRAEERGLFTSLSFFFALTKTTLKLRPDVVHLHSSFAGAIGRICLLLLRPFHRTRVIYCPHAFAFLMQSSMWRRRIYAAIERILLPLTDAVICVSQYELQSAISFGIPHDKLHVIPNGVNIPNPPLATFDEGDRRDIRLLYVGRLDRQKGFDILLQAMQLLEKHPVQLTVVGGQVRGHSQPGFHHVHKIHYVGWISQESLANYYRDADLLVVPSRWEGLAMAPLEAMSYGLAVLTSDFPSLVEVVGESGLTFPTEDPVKLASTILSRSPKEWKTLGLKGYQRVSDHFSSTRMAWSTIRLYTSCVARR